MSKLYPLDAQAILDVLPAASDDAHSPIYGVRIEKGLAIATDGTIILVSKAPCHLQEDGEPVAIAFSKEAVSLLKKAAKKPGVIGVNVEFLPDGKQVLVHAATLGSALCQLSPYTYPHWRQVIPMTASENQAIGRFNMEQLARLKHLGHVQMIQCGSVDNPIARIVGHPRVTGVVMGITAIKPGGNAKQKEHYENWLAWHDMRHVLEF